MDAGVKIWCDEDEHHLFEYYSDFNEWLDSDEGQSKREQYGLDELSQPSKAFYAGDREAYDQVFRQFRMDRRHESLSESYLSEKLGGDHWFERNLAHFEQLVNCMEQGGVVPFIGAGISVSGGFPSWEGHLREQGRTAGIDQKRIDDLLFQGQYETIVEEIENIRSRDVFIHEIRDVFSKTGDVPEAIWRISELFNDTVITTNYDHLIEQAFDTGEGDNFEVINGLNILSKPDVKKVTIIKLHGDVKIPAQCILSKNQYDEAYGKNSIDLKKPIPKSLSYYYINSSLLFLGCSLNNDRTVELFKAIKESLKHEELPQHFSIEQLPDDEQALADRHAYLVALGITPIWFETGQFEYIENILRLAKSELSYRGVLPGMKPSVKEEEVIAPLLMSDIDFSRFLRDFIDIMPLLHWLHRHVPGTETKKYMSKMQRVFYAFSFFTEDLDRNLIKGVDLLLRPLSVRPNYEGYAEGKISAAFKYFQKYLHSINVENDLDDLDGRNLHELLTLPLYQFEGVIENSSFKTKMDYHAIRLIVALLRYARKQKTSPKSYLQMPESVNAAFSDFILYSISKKLGVAVPDRLDEVFSEDINQLCESAWCADEESIKPGFIAKLKYALRMF